jgi:hypothetical protein
MSEVKAIIHEGTDGDFEDCVGFIDGSVIVLRYKPQVDGEAYYTRKRVYGINAQAVCDWHRRFTFLSVGQVGSVHDSRAFKSTSRCKKPGTYFSNAKEYMLGDKGYALTNRMIVPYKEPLRHDPRARRFNKHLSRARVKIEHAFGVLKARFPSLSSLPVYIRRADDHTRAVEWISACFVLHNLLLSVDGDNDDWFNMDIEQFQEEEGNSRRSADDDRPPQGEDPRGEAGTQAGKDLRHMLKLHVKLLDDERMMM